MVLLACSVSQMQEAKPYPTPEQETFRGCTCASENASEDSVCGAVAHVARLLQGSDVLEYGCELIRGTRLGDTMCGCFVLLYKTCLGGFSHFPVGHG